MKFTVTMKDPDALRSAVSEAASEEAKKVLASSKIVPAERLERMIQDSLYEAAAPFFEYSEYLMVEIDTEAGTARVLKNAP